MAVCLNQVSEREICQWTPRKIAALPASSLDFGLEAAGGASDATGSTSGIWRPRNLDCQGTAKKRLAMGVPQKLYCLPVGWN